MPLGALSFGVDDDDDDGIPKMFRVGDEAAVDVVVSPFSVIVATFWAIVSVPRMRSSLGGEAMRLVAIVFL